MTSTLQYTGSSGSSVSGSSVTGSSVSGSSDSLGGALVLLDDSLISLFDDLLLTVLALLTELTELTVLTDSLLEDSLFPDFLDLSDLSDLSDFSDFFSFLSSLSFLVSSLVYPPGGSSGAGHGSSWLTLALLIVTPSVTEMVRLLIPISASRVSENCCELVVAVRTKRVCPLHCMVTVYSVDEPEPMQSNLRRTVGPVASTSWVPTRLPQEATRSMAANAKSTFMLFNYYRLQFMPFEFILLRIITIAVFNSQLPSRCSNQENNA